MFDVSCRVLLLDGAGSGTGTVPSRHLLSAGSDRTDAVPERYV
jgi:hypothetical protein